MIAGSWTNWMFGELNKLSEGTIKKVPQPTRLMNFSWINAAWRGLEAKTIASGFATVGLPITFQLESNYVVPEVPIETEGLIPLLGNF
jgi:hypothetical protein